MSPEPALHPNSFIGRVRECALLDAALSDTLAGHGRVVLISGEPGIGKTRLADEVSKHAADLGLTVVWGRCWQGAGAPPYWPIIQIIRALVARSEFVSAISSTSSENLAQLASLVPELCLTDDSTIKGIPRSSDPAQARFRLFDSVAALVRTCAGILPLILVIDDLHDADQSSLQMLSFIARGLSDSRVALLGTYRDAEVRSSPELSKLVGELHREGSTLPLGGLSEEEVAEFVESRAGRRADDGLVRQLYAATDGNPLFVDGVVRLMLAQGDLSTQGTDGAFMIPDGVRASIHRQISSLPERTNSILEVAAALGIEFNTVPLERAVLAGAGEVLGSMDEAAALGIIAPVPESPTSFRFTHALLRAAVYEAIGTAERSRLHGQIGEALEAVYSADLHAHLAEIANHFRLALPVGAAEKAITYSIRAFEAAAAVYAYEDAISQGEAAVALMKQHGGDPRKRAALLERLGAYTTWIGQPKREHLEAAIAAYDELNLPMEAAQVRVALGQYLLEQEPRLNTSQALLLLRKAEAVLAQGPPHVWLNRLYFNLGNIANDRYLIREALEAHTRAMQVGERVMDDGHDDCWCTSAAMVALIQSTCYGRIDQARVLLDRVWEKLPAIQPMLIWCAALYAGASHEVLGDSRSAQPWYARALASRLPSKITIDIMRLRLGTCCHWLGDLTAMRQHLADWQQFDPSLQAHAEVLLACADGDFERCRKLVQAGVESKKFKESGHWDQYGPQFMLAMTLRHDGDNARAEEILVSALAPCESDEMFLYREMAFRPERALNLAALGDLERAQAEISRCSEILAAGEDWRGLAGNFHMAAGYCSAAAGDQPDSEQHFVAAIETFKRLSLPWSEADTFQLWGQALAAAGQPRSANEKFDPALEIYRRIEAGPPWIDRVMEQRVRTQPRPTKPSARAPEIDAVFRQEGEFWTIAYGDRTFRLKDAKGLRYIAQLLSHPGEKFRVHDLVAMVEGVRADNRGAGRRMLPELESSGDLGDAGAVLDDKAKASYRNRMRELRLELDEAESMNDSGRVERARAELEILEQQLAAAVGIGGRDRKASAHTERARVVVTQNIRVILGKIQAEHPSLAHHFNAAIKTGYLCGYVPDPDSSIAWTL